MGNNPSGHPPTLVAAHPANVSNGRHGLRSPRMLEPRAEEVAEAIMAEPHVVPLDRLGAVEIGRLEALIEALDRELDRVGLAGRGQRVVWLIDCRLRASTKLVALLDRYAATPKGRSQWGRDLAESESLAESIRRRREAAR